MQDGIAHATAVPIKRKKVKTSGGAVEMPDWGAAVENTRLALRVIQARRRVSHRRPPILGNRQRRDFHIPTAPAAFSSSRSRRQSKDTPFSRSGRRDSPKEISVVSRPLVSGSSCVGIKTQFQYHPSIGKCSPAPPWSNGQSTLLEFIQSDDHFMKNLSRDWLAVMIALVALALIRAGILPHIPW
jgi:hypothetical protein